MFLPVRELNHKNRIIEDYYGKPVETIMQCSDFKSNFARRFSNRYIVKPSSATVKRESELSCKLSLKRNELETTKEVAVAAAENKSEDPLEVSSECGSESPKSSELPAAAVSARRQSMHRTEVAALNTQIELLRWQLKQTEANRQMHISLLEQVVTFLHRVREHMDSQQLEETQQLSTKVLASSFKSELPRSRSVFSVNKNLEYSMAPAKKMASKKMSKSISNVDGINRPEFTARKDGVTKEFSWKHSKLSLIEETNSSKKILEELTRLITLADTVLTTKLPHLSCCDGTQSADIEPPLDKVEILPAIAESKDKAEKQGKYGLKNAFPRVVGDLKAKPNKPKDDSIKNAFILNSSIECTNDFDGITNKFIEARDHNLEKYTIPPSPLTCGLEDDFASVTLNSKCDSFTTSLHGEKKNSSKEKKTESAPSCIEDESGFSSMSSFQEIGIPIINVIPPTPSKEMSFLSEPDDVPPGDDTWKTELTDLDKQSMKVFWV